MLPPESCSCFLISSNQCKWTQHKTQAIFTNAQWCMCAQRFLWLRALYSGMVDKLTAAGLLSESTVKQNRSHVSKSQICCLVCNTRQGSRHFDESVLISVWRGKILLHEAFQPCFVLVRTPYFSDKVNILALKSI